MEAKEIQAEISRLQALKKSRANIIDGMKKRLEFAMNTFEIDEIKTATNRISFRKSVSTVINDVDMLPGDCVIIEKKPISATEIKKMIQNGRAIPGAELVEKRNIQIK